MTLSLEVARRTQAVQFADLPEHTRRAASVSLADALATMIAAVRREAATAPFHELALGAGPGRSTLLAGGTAHPALAALANGALSHALDFEDTFDPAGLHPNAALVPAVLALAEAEGAVGEEVLTALAVGCDMACRIGLALAADPARRGWYHPPMVGGIGAAFGAARLLRLTPEQTVSAVSLAMTQFALTDELKRSPASDLRAVRDAFPARAAVEGALLARAGIAGTDAPLEGEGGLFAVLTGQGPGAGLNSGLGRTFHGGDVSLKQWPSCRGTHRFIAVALMLRDAGAAPGDICSVAVTVQPPDDMLLLPEGDRWAPRSAIGAKFSIPFTFASALCRGAPALEHFADAGLGDAIVLGVARRVRLDRVEPAVKPRVWVGMNDGRVLDFLAEMPPAVLAGDASPEQLAPKIIGCLDGDASTAGRLVRAVGSLALGGIADLTGILRTLAYGAA